MVKIINTAAEEAQRIQRMRDKREFEPSEGVMALMRGVSAFQRGEMKDDTDPLRRAIALLEKVEVFVMSRERIHSTGAKWFLEELAALRLAAKL